MLSHLEVQFIILFSRKSIHILIIFLKSFQKNSKTVQAQISEYNVKLQELKNLQDENTEFVRTSNISMEEVITLADTVKVVHF